MALNNPQGLIYHKTQLNQTWFNPESNGYYNLCIFYVSLIQCEYVNIFKGNYECKWSPKDPVISMRFLDKQSQRNMKQQLLFSHCPAREVTQPFFYSPDCYSQNLILYLQFAKIDFPRQNICLYHPSLLAGLLDYILCPYRIVVGKF